MLEEAYALCIAALIRLGRRHDARVLMLELERRMEDELGCDIAPETAMLQSVLRGSGGSTAPDVVPVAARITAADRDIAVRRAGGGAGADRRGRRASPRRRQRDDRRARAGWYRQERVARRDRPRAATGRFAPSPAFPPMAAHPLYVAHRLMRRSRTSRGSSGRCRSATRCPQRSIALAEMLDRDRADRHHHRRHALGRRRFAGRDGGSARARTEFDRCS